MKRLAWLGLLIAPAALAADVDELQLGLRVHIVLDLTYLVGGISQKNDVVVRRLEVCLHDSVKMFEKS